LTVGKRNREYLEHYGVPSEKMFFAPHFVDNEWFAARAAEVRRQELEVRKEWGARAEDLVALFVGKFIPKKRPADLLKAMVNLRGESTPEPSQEGNKPTGAAPLLGGVGSGSAARPNPEGRVTRVPPNSVSDSWNSPLRDALAVFVGSGELEPALRADAEALGARAHFAGFKNQSELPRYYAAADVLVLPSDGGETWGLVVNEAMACGLPAIVSDAVGCAPDLIEEGRTGFTFPVGDCAQLALRLESLAEMKMRRHDFARALAEKMGYYSVAAAVSGTVRAARALASKGQTK
jgi:glycosyltransferase involved in cell wall biosynthesis